MNNHDICLVICFYAGPREGDQQRLFKNYLEMFRNKTTPFFQYGRTCTRTSLEHYLDIFTVIVVYALLTVIS